MQQRIAAFTIAGLLLGAGVASAQNNDLGGTIAQIDAVAHTVTFKDGRIAHYEPLWRILVNGREVALTGDPPGAIIAVAPTSTTSTTTTAVVPGTAQPAMVQVPPGSTIVMAPAPGYAPATVTRIDRTTNTMTLSDGRVMSMNGMTAADMEKLQAGTQVYVTPAPAAQVTTRQVRSTGVQTTTVAPAWVPADREVRGRVQRVDARGSHVVLNDGRTVYVSPSAGTKNLSTHTVTVTDLQPGDDVVIQVQEVTPVAGPTAGAVHAITVTPAPFPPSYTFPGSALVAPDRVLIVRYPQAA